MNKFNNKKTKIMFHGELVTVDSKKEAERGIELQLLEKAGQITKLQRQVPYTLIDKSKYGRAIKYVADYIYYENGTLVVEDVKSPFTRKDKMYRLKKRMMAEKFQIELKEYV